MFGFEKLDVWRRSIDFAGRVYLISRSFPSDERFGLTNRIRRAAVSVSSNIAEDSGRASDVDFARFLEFSYSSLMEVVSQATIALEQRFLTEAIFSEVYQEAEKLARMLSGLRSTLVKTSGS